MLTPFICTVCHVYIYLKPSDIFDPSTVVEFRLSFVFNSLSPCFSVCMCKLHKIEAALSLLFFITFFFPPFSGHATQLVESDFPDSSVARESACSAGVPSLIPGLGRSPREGMGYPLEYSWASLVALVIKNLPANARDNKRHGFHPWVWKIPWSRNGTPLQYSCLENFTGRGAWWAIVQGLTKSSDKPERLSTV